jgi:hypothetical protein
MAKRGEIMVPSENKIPKVLGLASGMARRIALPIGRSNEFIDRLSEIFTGKQACPLSANEGFHLEAGLEDESILFVTS